MNRISQVYREACREIALPATEKILFMKLLRELSVNAVKSQKAWQIKEDFIALWFMSAGRFPELASDSNAKIIIDWVAKYLPFELTPEERLLLHS